MHVLITRTRHGLSASLHETEMIAKAEAQAAIEDEMGVRYDSYEDAVNALETDSEFEITIHPISASGLFTNVMSRSIRRSLILRGAGDFYDVAHKTIKTWSRDVGSGVSEGLPSRVLSSRLEAIETLRDILAKPLFQPADYERGWDAAATYWTI